jgi:hypothetical protein
MKNLIQSTSNAIRLGIILGIILFTSTLGLKAQYEDFANLPQYLLPEFSSSTVKMKVGKDLTLVLNYNMLTGKMVFIQKNQAYDMINPGAVDTVLLEHRKFIPVGKVFYEVLMERPLSLYIEYKGSIIDPGKPAGYGGPSLVSSTSYINNLEKDHSFYNIKLPVDIKVKSELLYWISLNGEKYSFINERQLDKIFLGKENEIKAYLKKNRLKFENPTDVKQLVLFCSSLTK